MSSARAEQDEKPGYEKEAAKPHSNKTYKRPSERQVSDKKILSLKDSHYGCHDASAEQYEMANILLNSRASRLSRAPLTFNRWLFRLE